ncbi:hypothetical protein [Flavobacterium sp. GT3R68]|uniref:hypothetical protein n=1 Tax=Flavobacterium sp. GT3R68 TaxID=2594437 RepID=UPI000F895638|nr:hypothetical protein [Flavobacterium sp. GT3R68]RTY94005.1 hypothetical protein EKL32_14085 [Flavobacterium sp. GSN2]TRW93383.1 hypothetical protein FNW07_00300 [Flavobacterium sp. GT3R68]
MKIITHPKSKMKFLTFVMICFSVCSCDPRSSAIIVNNSQKDFRLKIQYDKESLEKVLKKDQIIPFLKNTIPYNQMVIRLDTINLISEIKVLPQDSIRVDSGRGFCPRFNEIKSITIYTDPIIELKSKKSMMESFKQNGNLFILEINSL